MFSLASSQLIVINFYIIFNLSLYIKLITMYEITIYENIVVDLHRTTSPRLLVHS